MQVSALFALLYLAAGEPLGVDSECELKKVGQNIRQFVVVAVFIAK